MNYEEIHRIKKHYNGKILTRLFDTVSRNHTTLYLSISIFNAYKYTFNIYITHTYNIHTHMLNEVVPIGLTKFPTKTIDYQIL